MQTAFEFYGDLPVRQKRPERLFFGLILDTQTSIHTEQFGQLFLCENHLEGELLKPSRLHVSLHHVGDYKYLRSKFLYAAKQAGEAVSISPFEVTFRCIKSFAGAPPINGRPPKRPPVLLGESDALFEFHKCLGAAMKKYGLKAAEYFTPHMILSYSPRAVSVRAIEPISFVANEFCVIHSKLGLTQYDMVDRWPLEG